MKIITKLIDVKEDWSHFESIPVLVKAVKLTEETWVLSDHQRYKGEVGDYIVQDGTGLKVVNGYNFSKKYREVQIL